MPRARTLTIPAVGLAALAAPAPASAHGLVQRSNLPIPEWLFGWAASIVLILSFVALAALWPKPRLEENTSWRALPLGIGRVLGSRPVEVLCGLIGVALFVVVILAGYIGSGTALDNLAPTFILITFWVGLVFASVLLGDVFRAFSPWRALGRVLPSKGLRPYPEWLGRWPAAIGLLIFTWIELASGWGEHPARLVSAALGYTVLTLAAQFVYGVETWSRYGESFSVYFNLFSRMSPFETRDRVLGVRPPLVGLPRLDGVPGTVPLVAVMIGTVTFDGLTQGRAWKDLAVRMTDGVANLGVPITEAPTVVDTLGLVICVLIVYGFYYAGIAGARSVGGDIDEPHLRTAFAHSLVPIAMVYVAAHYLTFLLFEGQAVRYLASDPFGQGWDLFGTAHAAIDYSLLSQNGAWYAQVGFVVVGHVAALILAHDRALVLYGGNTKLAVRSQYWMLAVMVGFTSLALWLLAQAGS
jgi:hypothetical protein